MTVVLVVVVGVIAFAAGLFSGGVFSHSSGGGGASAAPLTYAQAKSLSDARISGLAGGNWEETAAIGVVSPTAELFSEPSDDDCSSLAFYIPRFTGSFTAGTASVWLIEYVQNPSEPGPGEVLTEVENGTATINTYLPAGSDCAQSEEGAPVLTSAVVNSPTAAANASAAGGGGFLDSQPNSTLVYELIAGSPTNWTLEYDPCSLAGGVTTVSGTHSTFSVTMTASTGTVATTTTGTTTCVSSLAYDIGLTQGPAGTLTSGASFDNFTVVMGAPLPLTNLAVWIQTSSGVPVYGYSSGCNDAALKDCPEPAYGWYVTLSVSGVVQATYPTPFGASPASWFELSGGSVSNIQDGETLTVVSNGALSGSSDVLALLGLGGASVTSTTTL